MQNPDPLSAESEILLINQGPTKNRRVLCPIRPPRGKLPCRRSHRGNRRFLVMSPRRKESNYLWARPALVANKKRSLELQAGQPAKKGNQRGPAYAYNIKALRNRDMSIAEQAERAYEQFVSQWRPQGPGGGVRERLSLKQARRE